MRLWEGEQWVAKCKSCKNVISSGWVTFHQEHDEEEEYDPCTAYCYQCDREDPMWTDEKGKVHWTLRVRCQHWLPDWTQCENTWQSCRDKGSSLHVKCLNWWGWQKSCSNRWYCPTHAKAVLAPKEREQTECECSKKYPGVRIPPAAPPPGGAAPLAGPRVLAD